MSLLMQALKKAEQIKQKQSGIVPDEGFTLSPKESPAQPEIPQKVEVDEVSEIAPEPAKLESTAATMTLSPQMEDKPAELVSAEMELTHEVSTSAPVNLPLTSLPENDVPHQTAAPENGDAGTKEEKTPSDKVSETSVMQDFAAVGQKNISQPEMPKIGAEQTQITQQAEKIVLSEQKKAKKVFSSKAPQGNQRAIKLGVYALLSLLVVAAIAYFYWQSMSVGLLGANNTLLRTPPPLPVIAGVPATDAEATAKIASRPIAQASTAGAVLNNAMTTTASQATATNAVADTSRPSSGMTQMPSNATPVAPKGKLASNAASANVNGDAEANGATTTSSPAAKIKSAMATPIDDSKAIQIRRSSIGNQINPALSSAYQSFIAGDTASAKSEYQKVLQQEPNNRDALLGMAAIALNQRQAEQAGSFYGRLLELDPADPDAIAGLTSLQQGDPVQSESRLKKSLSQHPQAGAVLFALGNLYAQQSRWSDAQQTYFKAYTTTPGSADYAFNLAVSLDKLNQGKLAREYYQRALKLTQNSSGNFNRSDVEKRIAELVAIARE